MRRLLPYLIVAYVILLALVIALIPVSKGKSCCGSDACARNHHHD